MNILRSVWKSDFHKNELIALAFNLILAMCVYMLCRFIYYFENFSSFSSVKLDDWISILSGGLKFDLSAVLYCNILLIVLLSIPCHKKGKFPSFIGKILFVVMNGIGIVMNLSDAVYFKFTGRRTTATIFNEFSAEENLMTIFSKEFINHWYLVIIAIALVWIVYKFYQTPKYRIPSNLWTYYIVKTVAFCCVIFLTINGMRGGFGAAVRPITISNANQYVSKPMEAALVLNTPFSVIRTFGKKAFVTPSYFTNDELDRVYSPIHPPSDSVPFKPKNVVVLIVESFGREYVGALNKNLEPNYRGYTPFIDSLISKSLTFKYSYSNGRKSIDGMPSVLSSIPMFVEPFFLTPASLNNVSGLAGELAKKGYATAFFHGAQNGSMGFQAFANATGFQKYYGRTEYNEDDRFGGDDDFDGTWAIWDEPFLQFYARKMTEMKQPFMTAVFTATSHHPFVIPEEYKDTFPDESLVIHKCIRYTDHALRRFFEYASMQEWFENTLFVLTADHSNLNEHAYYQTDLGFFGVPILFYDPSGEMPKGVSDKIAQQIDIMPTVLGWLNYDAPYVAFGCDLIHDNPSELFAVNYCNGIYQYVKNGKTLQFDGDKVVGFYDLNDSLMQKNFVGNSVQQIKMENEVKAIVQQYMSRMNEDRLTITTDKK